MTEPQPRFSPTAMLIAWSALVVIGWSSWRLWGRDALETWVHRGRPTEPTTVLVVLDTVRADRLSLCGHDRPTSPVLEGLVARGARHTCRAYAPGSWTFPSHASLFTGLPVTAHGAHFVPDGTDIRQLLIRPLADEVDTLAERLGRGGAQALGVSGNPVLQPSSGLHQGFDDWRVAEAFGPWYGDGLVAQVRDAVRGADPGRPLLLFVNIADAHDPWFSIPRGNGVVPPRDDVLVYFETDPATGEILPDGPWQRLVRGEMSPDERRAFRQQAADHYDYAVSQADRTLGRVLDVVEAHGWADAGLHLVVTSDHGEFLGEHGLARHGRYLWEENQRVPLLELRLGPDGAAEPLPPFPEPVSNLAVHDLLLHRTLPDVPVEAVAFPDVTWQRVSGGAVGHETSAAIWEGSDKWHWVDGDLTRTDLVAEPREEIGEEAAMTPEMEALVERLLRARDRHVGPADPELIEALRAAGYVE